MAEDEYFGRMTPDPDDERPEEFRSSHQASELEHPGEAESPSQEGYSPSTAEKWHTGAAKHATLVHSEQRAASRQGVVNELAEAEPDTPQEDSPSSAGDGSFEYAEPAQLARATSVDYSRGTNHVRHISAGSARLLDVAPRTSTEAKRMSTP